MNQEELIWELRSEMYNAEDVLSGYRSVIHSCTDEYKPIALKYDQIMSLLEDCEHLFNSIMD